MKPKEKAQELLFQFSHANSCVKSAKNVPVGLILMRNKLCALIAVDEMISFSKRTFGFIHPELEGPSVRYLEEVKQEIEKL